MLPKLIVDLVAVDHGGFLSSLILKKTPLNQLELTVRWDPFSY